MAVSKTSGWYDAREFDRTIGDGGDDTAKIRAALDRANNDGGGCTVVLGQNPNHDYIVEGAVDLFANEHLVIPSGVRCLRPAGTGNPDPMFQMVRNYARLTGDGWIETEDPSPNGIIKFGPPGLVATYNPVNVTAGDVVIPLTLAPVPNVGDLLSIKCSDPNGPHFNTTVTAANASSVTIAAPAPDTCAEAIVYILDGAPQNVLWSHVRDLKLRGVRDGGNIAILMQSVPQGSGFGTYANLIENVHMRNFGEGVVFDAQANGNTVHHLYPFFVQDNIVRFTRSDECEVDGGFVHNSFNVNVFKFEDAFGNNCRIMAEPGGAGATFFNADALSSFNRITGGDNIASAPIDLGTNNTWNLRNQINFGQSRLSFFDDKPPLPVRTTNADIHQLGLAAAP